MTQPIVYMSGPMFSDADKWGQLQLAAAVEAAGHPTYLPQRDGFEMGSLMAHANDDLLGQIGPMKRFSQVVQHAISSLDVYQLIERCSIVVFNLDGRVPDEGSVSEAAMAYVAGRPVVAFKSTPITLMDGLDNPMLTLVFTGPEATTPTEAATAVTTALTSAPTPPAPPAHLAETLALGRLVWDHKDSLQHWLVTITADELEVQNAILDGVGSVLSHFEHWVERHL